MVVVVVALVVTNLVTLGALAYFVLRPPDPRRPLAPDATVSAALDGTPRPAGSLAPERRLISIEILNPVELAGTRGRLIGIAGSLVPGLTRRIVYDQTLRVLKQQLVEQHVVADVRLHTLRRTTTGGADATPIAVDEVERVDLAAVEDEPAAPRGDQATQ